MSEAISKELLAQRRRNRIIEYLDWVRSPAEHLEYERRVPIAHVQAEAIEQWNDSTDASGHLVLDDATFTVAEVKALKEFHSVWEVVCETYPYRLPLSEALEHPSAKRLMCAAEDAYSVMKERGPFSDEKLERTH